MAPRMTCMVLLRYSLPSLMLAQTLKGFKREAASMQLIIVHNKSIGSESCGTQYSLLLLPRQRQMPIPYFLRPSNLVVNLQKPSRSSNNVSRLDAVNTLEAIVIFVTIPLIQPVNRNIASGTLQRLQTQ